ncbi:MAG: 3-methyl-2-oxobutanoate hydroxymethyltransferase [Deltaproteobacteria bacterium]|nr:3-methyl-2-oxobutanoate hydroxymethyltransferase [Deltaproteobacteria bacterium]
MEHKALTAPEFRGRKGGAPLVMVTCYDASFARLVEAAGVDAVLVGDSLGNVIQGGGSTLRVTVADVAYHTRCVAAGLKATHLIADMPFLSYQVSAEDALRNAGRLIQEGGAHAVKLEGGARTAPAIRKIVDAGIPVMGHVGLTPQSFHQFGGYKVQGRSEAAARQVIEDAEAVVEAGAYSLVLEGIPADVAATVTASVPVPTIGIGASRNCDGQVLVLYDLLGMDERFEPKFLKKYASFADDVRRAVGDFAAEVRTRAFPDDSHSFGRARQNSERREKR